jgi:hypothetical protein
MSSFSITNPNGIYYTTTDELNFKVTINAEGLPFPREGK